MKFLSLEKNRKQYSKLAGLIYLTIAVVGGFSIGYMPSAIIDENSVSSTYNNLLDHILLFKIGMIGDLVVILLEVVLTVMLFQLYKKISSTAISIATYSRYAMAVIMGVNLVLYGVILTLVSSVNFLSNIDLETKQSLVLLLFKAHYFGVLSWAFFFSFHLLALGFVLMKSKSSPKLMGMLMLVGSIGYGLDSLKQFLVLDNIVLNVLSAVLLVLAVFTEFWFAFWLLFKPKEVLN